MSTSKDARKDAQEYARAQMFYGDGAGTRRKLIQATVESRAHRDPAYARAFRDELGRQDMSEHAKKAQKERNHIDRNEAISKNIRAIARGDNRGVNASLLVVGAVAYALHQTGYDKVLYEKARTRVENFRRKRRLNKMVKKAQDRAASRANFRIVD